MQVRASSCKFNMRLPVEVGPKETSWSSFSERERSVKDEEKTRKRQREGKRQLTRDGERKRKKEIESCYRIGKRDTVVGRFGQGCWQGEPGL